MNFAFLQANINTLFQRCISSVSLSLFMQMDYMEQEMLHMRNELSDLKAKQRHMTSATASSIPPTDLEEPLPGYTADFADGVSVPTRRTSRNVRSMLLRCTTSFSSNESLPNDDVDSKTLERAAMTHDVSAKIIKMFQDWYPEQASLFQLLENAAAESNQMRRELLKCRLQNRSRPK